MIKKIMSLLMCTLMMSPLLAGQMIYWPGYIDNSKCLDPNGNGECGRDVLNLVPNGNGTIYKGEDFWAMYNYLPWPGATNNVVKATAFLQFKIFAADTSRSLDSYNGIPLLDGQGHGRSSGYWLKGLGGGAETDKKVLTMRITFCDWDDVTCTPNTRVEKKEFSLSDFTEEGFASKTFKFDLYNRERIYGFEVWTANNTNFRLYLPKDARRGSVVRSVQMPGFGITGYVTGYYKNDVVHKTEHINIFRFTEHEYTRLNQRHCKLTADPKDNYFPTIKLTEDQEGQVAPELTTRLLLTCNGYTEDLTKGGIYDKPFNPGAPPVNKDPDAWKLTKKRIFGNDIVTSIQRIYVEGSPSVLIDGEQRIALKKYDKANGNVTGEPLQHLYVEGNLEPKKLCGQGKVIKLGQNLIGLPGTLPLDPVNDSKDEKLNINYGALYWKLCKTRGKVDAGDYKGTAKVYVIYR